MSPCADRSLQLHALLDGELDAVNALACEDHLKTCVACSAELQRLRMLRSRLSAAGVRFAAPAGTRERVLDALERASPSARPGDAGPTAVAAPRSRARVGALAGIFGSLAAALACVAILFWPGPGVPEEVVSSHVRSLLGDHLTDVETSDRHMIKPWFAGKVDFSPPVLELADAGFPLVGGRLDYVDGRVVSALVYRRRQHAINVFAWPASRPLPITQSGHRDGYNFVRWTDEDLQFWAVSDLESGELQRFHDLFVARAKR